MWLFGSLKTKNWQSFLKTLIRTNDQVFPIYASQQNLSVSPSEINAFLSNDLGILKTFNVDYQRVEKEEFIDFLAEQESGQKDIDQEFDNKFEEFINSIPENSIGIITGSLYLIGRVLERNQRRGD
jgi:folylpolyglutamate synthase/dihydropteroate synthase